MEIIYGGPVRMIYHTPGEGAWNMAVDEVLADSAGSGGRPVIRLYGFRSPTVSIGRFQAAANLNTVRLKEDGVSLVRRPTGGRAVLHDSEVTYSVALGRGHLRPFTKRAVYRFVGDLLFRALTAIGVSCRCNDDQIGSSVDPNCFDSVGEYELVGRYGKLVGSAQMVTRHGVLQHGSIPLDFSYQHLRRYLTGTPSIDGAISSWLARETGRPMRFDEVARIFKKMLEEVLDSVEISDLDAAEMRRVAEIIPRFRSRLWTIEGKTS